jgi:hypothetical protein
MTIQIANGNYTGNATNDTEINIGFQPDIVIVRDKAGSGTARIRTSTMAANASKSFNSASNTTTTAIRNFTANGFLVGTDSEVNGNLDTVQYIAFTVDSLVSAVFSYTGDGADDKTVGSFGFTPEVAMVIPRAAAALFIKTASMNAGDSAVLTAGGVATDRIQALQSGSIQVGATANVNARVYDVIVWKGGAGLAKSVRYVGTGGDDRNIPHLLGENPWFTAVMNEGTVNVHFKTRADGTNESWPLSSTINIANCIQATDATNVQMGTSNTVNANTGNYNMFTIGSGVSLDATKTPNHLLLLGVG